MRTLNSRYGNPVLQNVKSSLDAFRNTLRHP